MKKEFKVIVSVILSLTFIVSYLNLISNDVSANTVTLDSSISEGVMYTGKGFEDMYVFTPKKSGYYCFESDEWGYVYTKTLEYFDDYDEPFENYDDVDWVNIVPINYEEYITDSVRTSYYLTRGETYYVAYDESVNFSVREVTRYVQLYKNCELANVGLDEPFTLSLTSTSTVQVDNITYNWVDIPNNPGYYSSSVTLSLGQLLDKNNKFVYAYEDFEDEGDFGRGFVSCYVEITSQGKDYGWYVTFDIVGYESSFGAKCHAYPDYDKRVNYHEVFESDEPLFEVSASVDDPEIAISYQWYKKDPTKQYTGDFEVDKKYYTKLNGFNTNELWMSNSFLQAIGEPNVKVNEGNYVDIVTELACAVTFTKGNKSYIKVVENNLNYSLDAYIVSNPVITTQLGKTVTLPKDGKNDGKDGRFDITDLPENFEYKIKWYQLPSEPDDFFLFSWGEDVDIADYFSDYVYLGQGKQFAINTSNIYVSDTEFGKVSYILCSVEPCYNGQKVYSENNIYTYGYFVYEIHYCDIKITKQPVGCGATVGSTAKFHVDAEGEGLTYQWQLRKGSKWANLTSGGATTPTLSVKVDETKDGKCYRCLITDKTGSTVPTDEVYLWIVEPDVEIINQPVSYVGQEGSTAKFHVDAEGENLTYQWQLKKGNSWANLSSGGATTDTMSIKVDASKNGKTYRCLVFDRRGYSVATEEVTITVKEPDIKINTQPVSFVGQEGSTAKFTVAAEGEGLTYQWQLKKGKSWADLSSGGAKTSTMSLKIDQSKDGKVYRCLITNAAGEQLASNEVSITIKEPDILITEQPVDATGPVGTKVKFNVAAVGEGLTYQWQLKKGNKWADLSSGGAKTSEMTIKIDDSKDGKIYRCLITNAAGEQLASDEVSISVIQIRSIPSPIDSVKSSEPAAATVNDIVPEELTEPVIDPVVDAPAEPVDAPAEEAPAEAQEEAPAEEPAQAPVSAEPPEEAPAEAPAPEPAEAPVEEPA